MSLQALGGLDYGPAPESDKHVRDWLKNRNSQFKHFIGGKFQEFSPGGETLPVLDPSTGEIIARISRGKTEDVDAAMSAAGKAFADWSATPDCERARYLYAIARTIAKHSRRFAVLESLNSGKPIRETRDADIPLVVRHFYNHAGWAQILDKKFPNYRPGGVIAQIIPWNFPLLMLAWKIAPAIAAGNTVVLKPAKFTPLTAMMFAEMLQEEAKLPPGVVNIVNGNAETGQLIVRKMAELNKHDKRFWAVKLTGSTEVGRWLRQETAGSDLHLTLELGGKSPFIVFDDADIDSAVEGLVNAIWFNYGQVCCAGSRLLIQESVYDEVIRRIKNRMAKLRGGAPLDKAMDLGAVNSEFQLNKIQELVERGRSEGVEIWQPPNWASPAKGYHYPPTLVTNVQPAHILAQEEVFGPVLVCLPFRTPKEAVELANNTTYGLAASVWTQDVDKLGYMDERIEAGTVWNNCHNLFDAAAGFGGYKESGFGRESGEEGMYEVLVEDWPKSEMSNETELSVSATGDIDRTFRFLIGGKLVRPDGGGSFPVISARGDLLGVVGDANRKDVRDAVRAARKALADWKYKATGHLRAQILYFMAENLSAHRSRFFGAGCDAAAKRLFHWAALADKFGGTVQQVPGHLMVIGKREPIGVLGIRVPDDSPLLGLATLVGAAVSMGNTVVAVAGKQPVQAAEFMQIVQISDVPDGVINILTAENPDAIALELAKHKDVNAIWSFSSPEACAEIKKASVSNLKRVWTNGDSGFDWRGSQGKSESILREATHIKNIWTPYGV